MSDAVPETPETPDVLTRAGMNQFIMQALQSHLVDTVPLKVNLFNKFAMYCAQLLSGGAPGGEADMDTEAAVAAGEEKEATPGEEVEAEMGSNPGNTGGE